MRFLKTVWLAGALALVASGAGAVEKGKAGIGFFGSAHVPMFKFADWYSVSPKMGVNFNYVLTPKVIVEIEYNYSTMRGGDLKDREFKWSVDSKNYKSPGVSQSMWFQDFVASGLVHMKDLSGRGASPYFAGGLGFSGFSHEVSGLIFPGQSGTTIDPAMKLQPYKDKWAALTFSVGGGVDFASSDRFLVDLRVRYNIAMGEIRPLEDWGLIKAFPVQAFDVAVGFKFFW